MWDPSGGWIEPMSAALADGFFTTEPPGKKPCKLLTLTILTGMRCNLIVVLIFTSLMISDVEPIFHVPVPICMSYLEKCQFRFSFFFLLCLFIFMYLQLCMSCLCILDISSMLVIAFENIFSHLVGSLFALGWFSLHCKSF